jgi:predicted TIM-barrel fold metal-dependent hydrolase
LKEWSIERSIEDMEEGGVSTAILSITTLDMPLGERNSARAIVRYCNEYAAGLMSDHPGRFGMFAFLPLPDIDGALEEIRYALDTLKVHGIGLFTSYEDIWLGDSKLAPVFEELNRRKAVVYTHPAAPSCCRNLVPGLPPQMIEYGTDTTRTIASMVFSGAAARYPNIKMIFSHAGGTMPFLIERFDVQERLGKYAPDILPHGVRAELRKFFYDTAQSSSAEAMGALRNIVPVSQIVFGTDFPYRHAIENVRGLADSRVFSAEDLRAIDQANVLRILPRLRAN